MNQQRNSKITIALVVEGLIQPAWLCRMFNQLDKLEGVTLHLWNMNNDTASEAYTNNIFSNKRIYSWLYKTLIERHTYIENALKLVECDILKNIDSNHQHLCRIDENNRLEFEEEMINVKTYSVDFVVNCSRYDSQVFISTSLHCGLLYLAVNEKNIISDNVAGFWPSMLNQPSLESQLYLCRGNKLQKYLLDRSHSKSDSMSLQDNASGFLWKTAEIIPRFINRYIENENIDQIIDEQPLQISSQYSPKNFSDRTLTLLLIKKLKQKIIHLISEKLFHKQWQILYCFADQMPSSMQEFKRIIPDRNRFYADPFVFFNDDKYYVFIEELEYTKGLGYISVIEFDKEYNVSSVTKVLQRPYHLSYPYVFKHGDDIYMIPETCASRCIELYRCIDFPYHWEFQKYIMEDVVAVDSSVIFHNDKWWLFTNLANHPGVSLDDELYIYSANDLLNDKWIAHPCNPVVSDCRQARSAGSIFKYRNKMYRPSQNCSKHYGFGFNISEIKILNENEYFENLNSQITPDWDRSINATHTFNFSENLYVSDCIIKRWRSDYIDNIFHPKFSNMQHVSSDDTYEIKVTIQN